MATCPGCTDPIDPDSSIPTVPRGADVWHLPCMGIRERLGLDTCTPPMSRTPARAQPRPVSEDPEAIARMRRR